MKNLILIFLLLLSSITFSQKIKGYILDINTQEPIYRAHIQVGNKIVLSNKKGFFSFYLDGKKSIKITHLKYEDKILDIKNKNLLRVFLKEKRENLDEVKIVTNKPQDYLQYKELQDIPVAVHSFGTVLKNNKILIFAGDGSFKTNSSEFEKNKILFTGINEFAGFMEYATMPKFTSLKKYRNDILEYDIEKNNWTIYKDKLRKRANLKAVNIKDEIYLLGGKRKTRTKEYLDNKIEVFNYQNKSILIDNTNPHQAVNFGTAVYKDKIIVAGGSTKINSFGDKTYSDKIHFYNSETGNWFLLTNMKIGKETTSIVLGNKLYLLGGFRKEKLDEIESYNLTTDTWKKVGSLFKKMEKPALTKHKNIIYLFENNALVTFNTKNKELKTYAIKLPLIAAEMFYKNNSLYIFGGYKDQEYATLASKKMVKVSLSQLSKTKIRNQKILK